MVQKRGWSVSTGGSIELTGKGRTLDIIRQEVIAKALAEEREQAQQPALPDIRVAEGNMLFATSRDLCEWQCSGWDHIGDAPGSVLSKLAGEVLQCQSRNAEHRGHTRWTQWGPYPIELYPLFTFRGRMLGDVPCIAVLVSHAAKAPPEMTVAELCGGASAEKVLGLEVRALPLHMRGEIVGYVGRLGEGQTRAQLLEVTKSDDMREAIQSASSSETVWQVKFGLRSGQRVLSYIGSKLQPQLTFSNLERLGRLMGGSMNAASLGRESILRPSERRQLVEAELERLQRDTPGASAKLFPSSPERVCSIASQPADHHADKFVSFARPKFIVGGEEMIASTGTGVWAGLEKHGLYKYEPNIGQKLTMRGYVLGKTPTKRDFARAKSLLSRLADLLRNVHLEVDLGPKPLAGAKSVTQALSSAESQGVHAVVLFGASGSANWYYEAKEQCFRRKAPGLAHLASQWVDLSRADHQRPALLNMALQLCGKLGHTPFVLQSGAVGLSGSDERGPVLCGVDVCHLHNPQAGKMEHVIAGLQLQRANGEVEHSWICQGRIQGESIPSSVWKTVVSKEACAGRDVVIHRDGRFTEKEKEFLAEHAKEVGASGGAFSLVEIVKYAGGTPRMYAGDSNAPAGSFMRLSDTEGLLISGSGPRQGTANPLLIRVVGSGPGSAPKLSVDAAAEDIYRLSLVAYGSLYASPRLPVTTKTADKAAYYHASAEVHKAEQRPLESDFTPISHGRQQYWL